MLPIRQSRQTFEHHYQDAGLHVTFSAVERSPIDQQYIDCTVSFSA